MRKGKIRHYGEWIAFHLSSLPQELRIAGGHKDYRRFIILATARSGSNFLRGLLNSHSQVMAFGELFREMKSIGWDIPVYDQFMQSRHLRQLAQHDPVGFLENAVFKRFPKKIKAVGFKLFYYHAQDESRSHVWRFLREQKDLRVIHLKRNNTLRTMLSLKKAFKTDSWTNTLGAEEEKTLISLNYEECLESFKWAQDVKKRYDDYFEEHPKIEIIYEQLVDDMEGELTRIQRFLGIDPKICKSATSKQANQPLSEAISNYFDLKAKFRGSQWEVFFED
jgi:LPS sulfotransferase NodH